MVVLVPMNDAEFAESFERNVTRLAGDCVRRGVWVKEKGAEAARAELNAYFPRGRESLEHHFVKAMVERKQVGEAWYSAREAGGKVRFWIDWLWIDPQQRRRGYATAVIQRLSREAATLGADRIGLNVFADNPNAIALYTKLGFTTAFLGMSRPVK